MRVSILSLPPEVLLLVLRSSCPVPLPPPWWESGREFETRAAALSSVCGAFWQAVREPAFWHGAWVSLEKGALKKCTATGATGRVHSAYVSDSEHCRWRDMGTHLAFLRALRVLQARLGRSDMLSRAEPIVPI